MATLPPRPLRAQPPSATIANSNEADAGVDSVTNSEETPSSLTQPTTKAIAASSTKTMRLSDGKESKKPKAVSTPLASTVRMCLCLRGR